MSREVGQKPRKKESNGTSHKSTEPRKQNLALLEVKQRGKLLRNQRQQENEIQDVFKNAFESKNMIRGKTGLIYDKSMALHYCLWDSNHPEKPERYTRILERCEELNLIERCKVLPSRKATKNEILLVHTEEHFNLLKSTSYVKDEEFLEELSSKFDSIYIHPLTFELSLLAAGSTIDLVHNIVSGRIQNGMAIVRPPGHHAMKVEFNGYCFFNNVTIATQYALNALKLNKVIIIDWDVHHGQGTQRFFYNDPRVLYFSIHRFDHGAFWPNLKESDFDAIGEGLGLGYNFNIPLNRTGMKNGDYLAIFQQILLPVTIEFQPELIIISAGFDAALGCPEGEMEITPACYPHLLHPLLKIANSRVAVILEGGYCLESLAEGAALTLRSLLDDPCPLFVEKLEPPCQSIQDSILNCIYSHRSFWKCLQTNSTYTIEELNNTNPQTNLHKVNRLFVGGPPVKGKFPTRNTAPLQNPEVIEQNQKRLKFLKAETCLTFPSSRVCYVYDDIMLKHVNLFEKDHLEKPERISKIKEMLIEYDLLKRMVKLNGRYATEEEIYLVHTRAHVKCMREIVKKSELKEIANEYNSVYFHPKTFESASWATGSILEVVDAVLKGEHRCGVCIIRPPGHHAEANAPHGFCIFNNIAIAAEYAITNFGISRVLIVDWDIHHGNGTQQIFESNSKVLYISIHRYDNGSFFPKGKAGNFDFVGKGVGLGFNVNIPWNKKGMSDFEYVMAFKKIIMPIAYEFNPELVLISAGFDAAVGDPLGGCKVTPEGFGVFSHWLTALANGRVILCLEGGYNIHSNAYAMTMCSKSLLGDPLPPIAINNSEPSATHLSSIETIQNCVMIQKKYWKNLEFDKKLPKNPILDSMRETVFDKCQNDFCTLNEGAISFLDSNEINETSAFKELFVLIPLKNCPHISQLNAKTIPKAINTKQMCSKCNARQENWFCLVCNKVFCGRYVMKHMLLHNIQSAHPLALSLSDLSVWCFPCESYIDNRKLYEYKNLAYKDKFGEELLWTYENEDETALNSQI